MRLLLVEDTTDVAQAIVASFRRRGDAIDHARSDIEDRVTALDKGADDYRVKPFDPRELHARIRAMLRRQDPDRSGVISYGDIVFDPSEQVVKISGDTIIMPRRELSLLEILLTNRGRVVSQETLFERMHAFSDEEVNGNAVELYIGRLRRKLSRSQVSIKTLRGLGYQLVNEV